MTMGSISWRSRGWRVALATTLALVALGAPPLASPVRTVQAAPILVVEAPEPDATVAGAARFAGWAANPEAAAPTGTGIDDISLWLTGTPGAPSQRLGAATLGVPRPDVADSLGAPRFTPAGWEFTWSTAGVYTEATAVQVTVIAQSGAVTVAVTLALVIEPPTAPTATGSGSGPTVGFGALGPPEAVTIEGVALQRVASPNGVYYFPDTVAPERVVAAAEGVETVTPRIPELLGLKPISKAVNFYLFPSHDTLFEGIKQLQGRPFTGGFAEGVSFGEQSRRPGVFINLAPYQEASSLARVIGHEYVHQVIGQAQGRGRIDQWLNEGLANHVARLALLERYPDAMNSSRGGWLRHVAGAIATGTVIPFTDLDTSAKWIQVGNRGPDVSGLIYAEGALAAEYLASRFGVSAVARTAEAVGLGHRFPDAFAQAVGLSVAQFQSEFIAAIGQSLPAAVPAAAPAGATFNAVASGFTPREPLRIRMLNPNGAVNTTFNRAANDKGVAWVSFRTIARSLKGAWTFEITGEQSGAVARVAFNVE